MPCLVDKSYRDPMKEAAGFEFRLSTLNDLRARGILSDKDYKRKLKRTVDRRKTWERDRAEEEERLRAEQRRRQEAVERSRSLGETPRRASDRDRFLAACPDYDRISTTVSMDTLYFSAVVIQKVWRGVLTRLVKKCILIQAYWRGCMTRMRKARGFYAKARRSLRMVRGLSGGSMGSPSPKVKRRGHDR